MTEETKFYLIETMVGIIPYQSVITMLTASELEEAKKERPDLIFTLQDQYTIQDVEDALVGEKIIPEEPLREDQGVTIKGMTVPYNIEEQIAKVLDKNA